MVTQGACDKTECVRLDNGALELVRTHLECDACREGEVRLRIAGQCCSPCVPESATTAIVPIGFTTSFVQVTTPSFGRPTNKNYYSTSVSPMF